MSSPTNGPPRPATFQSTTPPAIQPAAPQVIPETSSSAPISSATQPSRPVRDVAGVLTFNHSTPTRPIQVTENLITAVSTDDTDAWDGDYLIDASSAKPEVSTWNMMGACAIDLGGGYTLNDLIKDTNGSAGFSQHRAAIGTVPNNYYLQVVPGMSIPDKIVVGRDPFRSANAEVGSEEYQKRILSFLVANRDAMLGAVQGLTPDHASFLALLRMNFAMAGGLVSVLSERAIYVNEYFGSAVAYTADMRFSASKLLVDYVAETWLQYVGVLRHLFVTRGHHYKDAYSGMIDRIWKTTTIEPPPGVSVPSWENVLRLGLHCFGIRSVNILVTDAYYKGTLAASLSTRFFAAPAGSAPVITSMAGINAMKKATWWPEFYEGYKYQIDGLTDMNTKVKAMGLRAHVNAKLFNWSWKSYKIDTTFVDALSPLILAFIDNLDKTESLVGQECLKKRGDGGGAIRRAFSASLQNEDRNTKYLESPLEFLNLGKEKEEKK